MMLTSAHVVSFANRNDAVWSNSLQRIGSQHENGNSPMTPLEALALKHLRKTTAVELCEND